MKDSALRYLSLLVLCWGLFRPVLISQAEFHYGSRYGERIGLSATPTSLVEDKYGFYWVGTREGLFRLDGTRAVELDIFSKLGKSDKWIYELTYDPSSDRLWLATQAGILSYELLTGTVNELDISVAKESGARLSRVVHSVLVDRQGDLWVGSKLNGIIRCPANPDSMGHYKITSSHIRSSNSSLLSLCNTVVHLVQDPVDDDIIWAGSRYGLIKINKSTEEIRVFEFREESVPVEIAANSMRVIYPDTNGRLYIGTWNGGLLEFDPRTESFAQVLLAGTFEENILSNQVTAIYPESERTLFVSGSGRRLFRYDKETRQLVLVRENAGVDLIDSKRIIWYMSDPDLISYHPVSNDSTRHYFPKDLKVLDMRKAIQGIHEEDKIWVRGKMKGGLLQFDRQHKAWTFFRISQDDQKLVDGNVVHDTPYGVLINDDEDLYLKKPEKDQFEKLSFRLDDEGDPFHSAVSPSGEVFISGRDGYFYYLHSGLTEMERYTTREIDPPFEGFFSESTVSAVDEYGRAWIHSAGGYSIFDPERKSFTHYKLQEDQADADLMIRDMCPDKQGRMWFTTVNAVGYFHTAEPETGIRGVFSSANGYDFNNVWYVTVDREGRPWIVEREGVVCLDPESGKVTQTGIYAYSIEMTTDGELIIGGSASLALLHPDSVLSHSSEVPKPYVCWVQSGHDRNFIGADPLTPKEIRIGPEENAFSLAFSALYLHRPGRVKWSYRLSGLEKDWNYPENYQTIVNYSGLRPGAYVFQLKATDMFGNTGPPYQLTIRVAPPWYRTKVSKAFFSAAILGLFGFLVYSGRRRYLLQLSLIRERSESSRLLELDRFKSKVFTNITHEIRTPLTIILGLAENLERNKEKKVAEAASRITENGNTLLEHINQMLDLARLDAGKIDLNPVRNDVVLFIRMTVQRFRPMAQAKNIHIGFHPEPDSFQFDYDPNYFGQVLSNLLGNAIKFSKTYGEVQVLFRGGESQIEVAVKDSGPGIHPDDLPRIFERFYTANHSLRITEGSSGIGLSLSNELIQLMGGRIEVQSAPGKGSSFRVILPVLDLPSQGSSGEPTLDDEHDWVSNGSPEMKDSSEDQDARPLILVIEDNPDLADYIRSIFSQEFRVIIADTGKSGLEYAITNLPEVIISDIMMPEMDGIEMCRQLKSDVRTSHIPLIFLTARVGAESRMEGMRAGAFGFLEKPFIQEELRLIVENALLFRQRIRDHLSHAFSGGKSPELDSTQESMVVSGEQAFLDKLNTIIEAGIADEDFDINRLCRAMGMSRAQLYRKLSSLTGVSVAIYIRNIRLAKARDLLMRTDQNVSMIAYAVGFSDPNYFSKVYHEQYGHSPSETRKSK